MDPHTITGLVLIGALLTGIALDAWLPGLPEKPEDPFDEDPRGPLGEGEKPC